MRLTKKYIGKWFKRTGERLPPFKLLAITQKGALLCEDNNGDWKYYDKFENEEFYSYEEPKIKKRIEAAPAVARCYARGFEITQNHYSSFVDAQSILADAFIWGPASWDKEKGCWYYKYEEEAK